MTKIHALRTVTLFLAALVPAAAQSTDFGVHGGLIFPQNDLRTAVDSHIGFAIGVDGAYNLQEGNEVRGRIDYFKADAGAWHLASLSGTTSVHCVGVGGDFLHYLEGRRRGLYGLGGLGLQWWSASTSQGNTNETSPYFQLGVGNRFDSSWNVEFVYQVGRFRSNAGTAGSIQILAGYRF